MPFKPGVAANPSGRTPMTPLEREQKKELDALICSRTVDAANKLIALMNCGNKGIELKAAESILNRSRIAGMPMQRQEITGDAENPLVLSGLSLEDLKKEVNNELKQLKAA